MADDDSVVTGDVSRRPTRSYDDDDDDRSKPESSFSDVTTPEPTADEISRWQKFFGRSGLGDLSGPGTAYRTGGRAHSRRRK